MDLYYRRDNCRLCHSANIELVVPLSPMPIATPNFAIPGVDKSHPVFREAVPLELHLCNDCGLLQVPHVGNPELQYSNYVYTTSLSAGLTEHFCNFASEVIAKLELPPNALVVEMGSNDGTLLRFFKDAGMQVQGIDPAREIARRATEAGIDTIGDFFATAVAEKITADRGVADVMIANNVLANIDDLSEIVAGVRTILADDGVFVFETQYGAEVVEHNLLDTVYHEHLSYFNIRPLQLYFAANGMEILDVERIETKGGSIRVFVQIKGGPRAVRTIVADMVRGEEQNGHYGKEIYRRWAGEITDIRKQLSEIVTEQRGAGRKVGGYGVSVGTTTLLPQFELTDKIDVLFDDDPNKDPNLIGPGYDIPVHPTHSVYDIEPGAIIIFAWRYADLIIAKHQRFIEQGGQFVVPLPQMKTY